MHIYLMGIYNSGTSVYKLNLFYDFGGNDCVCFCVEKMAMDVFVTRYGVCKHKQNYAEHFCLQI